MVGYEEATLENLENHGHSIVMTDYEHYGPGQVRSMNELRISSAGILIGVINVHWIKNSNVLDKDCAGSGNSTN